jgi:hypothetical protein
VNKKTCSDCRQQIMPAGVKNDYSKVENFKQAAGYALLPTK